MCIAWLAVFGRPHLPLYQLLSMCLTVGKERARIPCGFFPRYVPAHGRVQEPTRGSAVEHCRILDTGGGDLRVLSATTRSCGTIVALDCSDS